MIFPGKADALVNFFRLRIEWEGLRNLGDAIIEIMRGVDALFHRINLALQLRLDIVNVAQAYDKTRCGRREMIERNRNANDQLS